MNEQRAASASPESAVHAERAQADALLDAVADGIVVLSPEYKVLRTNQGGHYAKFGGTNFA